jgi:hypothetical protein
MKKSKFFEKVTQLCEHHRLVELFFTGNLKDIIKAEKTHKAFSSI